MTSIAHGFKQVLDLASDYSRDATPAMLKRQRLGAELATQLAAALPGLKETVGLAALDLKVKAGGRESYFSPVPWVRVYSPNYAPTAYRGTYLTYLFAADGSRVYLSLMLGTSEYRTGFMRPILDAPVVLSQAAEARSALGDLMESDAAAGAVLSIDLARQAVASAYSRGRVRAYEAANILAREYVSGTLPDDGQLLADLASMLPLLAHLYGHTPTPPVGSPPPAGTAQTGSPAIKPPIANGQGPLADSEVRKKVELWAEDLAIEYFTGKGWSTARRVGHEKRGYDLEFTNAAGQMLHVEVKGTRTRGGKVELTENEVRHILRSAACPADHALYVVSEIKVSREGGLSCSGGKGRSFQTWAIDENDLTPTRYSYTVPGA